MEVINVFNFTQTCTPEPEYPAYVSLHKIGDSCLLGVRSINETSASECEMSRAQILDLAHSILAKFEE